MTTVISESCMIKPPRPWSADINYKRKSAGHIHSDQKCYTTRSDMTYDKFGQSYDTKSKTDGCCVHECRGSVPMNPPPTPVDSSILLRPPQLPGRQPLNTLSSDEGRSIRLRTISHSAPPLNFKTNWNPLLDRHPGSAFDIVSSSASSSRTCTPEQTGSRAELCVAHPDFDYVNPIIKPIPRKSNSMKLLSQLSTKEAPNSDEETLPDRLFRLQQQQHQHGLILSKSALKLQEDDEYDAEDEDNTLTLPDRLFKAHMAKQAMAKGSPIPHSDVKPKIISKSLGSQKNGSIRNGLKDKFVLNIIESFNDQSNVLKELSNMKLDSDHHKPKKSKRKSFSTLKKTWSSIMNLAVGVPATATTTVEHAQSKDNLNKIGSSKQRHIDSLYTDTMYSTIVGDLYKSRSTACIAAL